jgi:hypothetical protein
MARIKLENKYDNHQSQYHDHQLEMEKNVDSHLNKLDE